MTAKGGRPTPPVAALRDIVVDYPLARERGSGTLAGHVRAIDGVSLEFHSGTSTAVVGRSGSGKSSLVSVLALMRAPSSGRVEFAGVDVPAHAADQRARLRSASVGMVFQAFHLEPHLTATENVMLQWWMGEGAGRRAQARRRTRDLLDTVGIAELADRPVAHMSGGQRQRVAIARALFHQPALVIADEPTGNLDEETAEAVSGLLFSLPQVMGAAVVVVTHDAAVAGRANRIVELVRGQTVVDHVAGTAGS